MLIISVYFHGDNISPQRITDALKVEPSDQQAKGDVSYTRSGSKITAKSGMWSYKTRSTSECIADHIGEILNIFKSSSDIFKELDIEEGYIDVFIAEDGDPVTGGATDIELTVKDIQALKLISLPLRIRVEHCIE